MAHIPYNEENLYLARNLRKNMTKEERRVWYDFLRSYAVKFRRQHRIDNYIVDFFCREANLVVEIDGGQHYEPDEQKYDVYRTQVLQSHGLTVLRFTNIDIHNNFRGVCDTIDEHVKARI
jgi:very-short-patch-repair endonuclease